MNCFLDIGSHTGEALEEALRPIYKIDSVYAVEPSTFGLNKLMKFKVIKVLDIFLLNTILYKMSKKPEHFPHYIRDFSLLYLLSPTFPYIEGNHQKLF